MWLVLLALSLVLSRQPFKCSGDEYWLACLGFLCVARVWFQLHVCTVGTSISLNGGCGVCTREMACFLRGPVDVETGNALLYCAFESPARSCFALWKIRTC